MRENSHQTSRSAYFAEVLKWIFLIAGLSLLIGSAVALFLWSLNKATTTRFEYPWLLYFLPLGGLVVVWIYRKYGAGSEGGNNLIMDQIHEPGGGVPVRMAPLVLFGTVVTHLFGGSAGREGTAVQMGGSLASFLVRHLRLAPTRIPTLLMAGMAGGFGAVFGTPLAGTVFALEVLSIGQIHYRALLPCFLTSVLSDIVCKTWGAHHDTFRIKFFVSHELSIPTGISLGLKVVLAAIAFGLCSRLFASAVHALKDLFAKYIPFLFRPIVGGLLVIGLVWVVGTRDYLGLSVSSPNPDGITLGSFFSSNQIHYHSFFWKFVFTTITLAAGFKGGEVTPLFFIGAALGNALAGILGAPPDLFAALGFVAVFGAASNTPIASMIMGLELFGVNDGVFIAAACIIAYCASGHRGIYGAQKITIPKH
ncbi:MAG: clcB [Verrucomicrobiales bacterium]|nr:clcB [Verrucomicrobiales bacterium]